MATYSFSQVDVFGNRPLVGNPVAVVHDATGLDDDEMLAFAAWTNLSETTFLLPAEADGADYRLRIFTPARELPFAGHPTLGSAHAWLSTGGAPARDGVLVQECALGLVELRQTDGVLSFRAPALLRAGEVDAQTLDKAIGSLGVDPSRVLRANWIDNGPGWLGIQLASADDVLALTPDFAAMRGIEVGVLGAYDDDGARALGAAYEVRAFCPDYAIPEDPVTGSLNAGFALWLMRGGHLPPDCVGRQGTALGRDGRVRISTDESGAVWVGGAAHTVVSGTVDL